MKRRVVVTGVGVISSIGNDYASVIASLRCGRSGTRTTPELAQVGLKSLVAGTIEGLPQKLNGAKITKSLAPGMSDAALYASLAALDAVAEAGLADHNLHTVRTGCVIGSSASGVDSVHQAGEFLFSGNVRRIDPFTAFRSMSSTCSAAVANLLKIGGRSYSLSSACATGTHCIGHAFELIRAGTMDCMIAGGAEELSPLITAAFQSMRIALSTRYNDTPEKACRPFDAARDGVVLSAGAGIVVLEELESAQRRGAHIHAEIVGFGATSDAYDLASPEPSGERAAACMRAALDDATLTPKDIGYINAHGTGTLQGDAAEANALRKVFGTHVPPFSSTKSMTGHAIAAAGAQEIIFCMGMMEHRFLAPSINIETLDPAFADLPIVRERSLYETGAMLTNSFGFGGTNASLILDRPQSSLR